MSDALAALCPVIEAVLFTAGDPLTLAELTDVCELDEPTVREVLAALRTDYITNRRGLQLVEVAGGYQLATRPEHAVWVSRLHRMIREVHLTRPALESLAIIAYRQPITRHEVEIIRGVDCAGVLKTVLERRLVKITGRKPTAGRPLMYGTTREFLQCFGLNDLSELPRLREFEELTAGNGPIPLREAEPAVVQVAGRGGTATDLVPPGVTTTAA